MTTLDNYDFCKPYIMDNEYILWEGAPQKGLVLTSRDLALIPFSLIWLAFSLFWEVSAIRTTGSLFMVLWGLPFVGVGIYLLFGRFLQTIFLHPADEQQLRHPRENLFEIPLLFPSCCLNCFV